MNKRLLSVLLGLMVAIVAVLVYGDMQVVSMEEERDTVSDPVLDDVSSEPSKSEVSNIKTDDPMVSSQTEVAVDLPWNLVLVNKENPLPSDYSFTKQSYSGIPVDERMYSSMTAMLNDAINSGMNLWIASGYRSEEEQEAIIDREVSSRMNNNNMSEEEAIETVMLTMLTPGASEHHTGLAIDFNYVSMSFKNTDEYQWLLENAEDYGFILRYPADKADITGIDYEPWHFRYVGIDEAKEMNSLGYCLEEYIDYYIETYD